MVIHLVKLLSYLFEVIVVVDVCLWRLWRVSEHQPDLILSRPERIDSRGNTLVPLLLLVDKLHLILRYSKRWPHWGVRLLLYRVHDALL